MAGGGVAGGAISLAGGLRVGLAAGCQHFGPVQPSRPSASRTRSQPARPSRIVSAAPAAMPASTRDVGDGSKRSGHAITTRRTGSGAGSVGVAGRAAAATTGWTACAVLTDDGARLDARSATNSDSASPAAAIDASRSARTQREEGTTGASGTSARPPDADGSPPSCARTTS